MFKFHDVEQNTDEWMQLRCGKLTSSPIGKVMANYGKPFGDPAKQMAVNIAIEQITGKKIESNYSNAHMERGHEQEPLARQLYEETTFNEVTNGGFFETDTVGCSPDGLVGDDGVIEIKAVIAHVHFANIKRMNVDPAYRWQCISNVKYTGRKWIDFVSYCADFPEDMQLFVYRLYAKDLVEEFGQIDYRVSQYLSYVHEVREKILETNYVNIGN